VAAGSCDLSIKIWNINERNAKLIRNLTGHKNVINSIKFMVGSSFINPVLVSGSSDRTLKFWRTGETVTLNCTSAWLWLDALMMDGIVASGHLDGSIRIWSGKKMSLVYRFASLHEDAVNSLWINPITYTIASVAKDHSLKLCDYRDFKILDEVFPDEYVNIKHSSESISCGSYSQHIVLASANGKILIYNLENKKEPHNPLNLSPNLRSHSLGSYADFHRSTPNGGLKLKLIKVTDVNNQK
jgi:WD40 repeat protein